MAIQTPFVSIMDFGAKPGNSSPAVRAANSDAFDKAQDAMNTELEVWGHPLFVPSGLFYLERDLHISKSLELFGTGMQGESVLVLPEGSSIIIDPSTNTDPTRSGSDCSIRDLQIHCSPRWSWADPSTVDLATLIGPSTKQPAIWLQAPAIISRVIIRGFWGTGIYIFAGGSTNANQWRIHDVYISECGGHGIHVDGGETQGGFCSGVKIIAIGGNGIYESSFGGNTYVGCYVEESRGRGYLADTPGQATFVGCFAESPRPSLLGGGGVVWLGGGASGFENSLSSLILESYGNVHPFEVPNQLNPGIKLLVGYQDNTDALLGWQAAEDAGDFWLFRWRNDLKCWATEWGRTFPDTYRVSYQTGVSHIRGRGLHGFPHPAARKSGSG